MLNGLKRRTGMMLVRWNGNKNISHHFCAQISVDGWKPFGPQGLVVGQAWQYVAWGSLFRLGENEYPRHLKNILFHWTLPISKKTQSRCLCCRGGAQHAVPASKAPMAHRKDRCVPAAKLQPAVSFHVQICRVSIQRNFLGSLCDARSLLGIDVKTTSQSYFH